MDLFFFQRPVGGRGYVSSFFGSSIDVHSMSHVSVAIHFSSRFSDRVAFIGRSNLDGEKTF